MYKNVNNTKTDEHCSRREYLVNLKNLHTVSSIVSNSFVNKVCFNCTFKKNEIIT